MGRSCVGAARPPAASVTRKARPGPPSLAWPSPFRGILMDRKFLSVLGLLVFALSLAGCQFRGVPEGDSLKIGAYSVVREVFHDGLIPAFAAQWKSKTGRDVQFEESYN